MQTDANGGRRRQTKEVEGEAAAAVARLAGARSRTLVSQWLASAAISTESVTLRYVIRPSNARPTARAIITVGAAEATTRANSLPVGVA